MISLVRTVPCTTAFLVLAALPLAAQVPAPPREEAISVCVIDPTVPTGFRQMSAVYLPTTGDTLVIMNGQRVPLSNVAGTVPTGYTLITAGQPLRIVARGRELQFVTYGTGRVIESDQLAFLGTVDGIPVYADRDEAQDIMEELQEARSAEQTYDLEAILEERDDLREDIEDIEVLYVPLQPTACYFQPVMRVEMVRGVRG